MSKKPEEEREAEAEDKAGDDREVEGGVFAAMDDVAGEAAQTEGEVPAEVEKGTEEDEQAAKQEKRAAEFAERIHGKHSSGTAGPRTWTKRREIPPLRRPASAQRGRERKPACSVGMTGQLELLNEFE